MCVGSLCHTYSAGTIIMFCAGESDEDIPLTLVIVVDQLPLPAHPSKRRRYHPKGLFGSLSGTFNVDPSGS